MFTKFSWFAENTISGHLLKFGRIRLRGFVDMRLKFRGLHFAPNFRTPSGETIRRMPVRFAGARMVQTTSVTIPSLVGVGLREPPVAKKL